ncbi:MAG: hypothetical protein R6W73_01705 [Candidatus Saliniplasma sp.]
MGGQHKEDIYESETVDVEDDGLDMMIAGIILIIVITLAIA